MRILAIRGCNLASLAGEFAVELGTEPLVGAGLFAITGPTGAGKSTLLDALCLALFDRTPRLQGRTGVPIGHAGEDEALRLPSYDVRSILRRGTGEGWAEVDFAGRDGRRYRARWAVRRARRQPDGRFQKQDVTLEDLDAGTMLGGTRSETLAAIEDRLGLSFEQFCRSALLAQGDFAAFLKADAAQRAELLERMTGTEIYGELSRAAYRRWADERRELEALEAVVGEHRVLAADERATLEVERARADEAVEQAAERLRVAEEAERCRLEHAQAVGAIAELEAHEAAARAAEARAAEACRGAEARLDEARAAQRAAEPELEEAGRLDNELEAATRRYREVEAAWQEAKKRADASSAELARLERDAGVAARDILGAAAALDAARVRLSDLAERCDRDAQARSFERDQAREALLAAVALAERALAQAAEQPLDEARARLDELRARRDELRVLEALVEQAARAAAEAGRHRTAGAEARAVMGAAAAKAAEAAAALATLEVALAEATRAFDQMRLAAGLADHRAQLVEGEACPLCGATEHPWAAGAAVESMLAEQRRRVDELRAQVAAEGAARAEAAATAEASKRALEEHERQGAACEVELVEVRRRWRAALGEAGELALHDDPAAPASASWVATRAAAVASSLAEAQVIEHQADKLQRALVDAQGKVDARRSDLEQARDRNEAAGRVAEEARRDARECESACARARGLVAAVELEAEAGRAPVLASVPADAWREALERVETQADWLKELRARRVASQERLDEQQAIAETCRGQVEEARAAGVALRAERGRYFSGAPVAEVRRQLAERVEREAAMVAEAGRSQRSAGEAAASATARLGAAREAAEARAEQHRRAAEVLAEAFARGAETAGARAAMDASQDSGLDADVQAERPGGRSGDTGADTPRASEPGGGALAQLAAELAVAAHQPDSQAIARAVALCRQALTHASEVRSRLRVRLEVDDEARTRRARLEQDIRGRRRRAELSQSLAELIGSADGTKFRKYAQSLTLEALLAHANHHLSELSPRYRLQRVPGYDLDLQVIDRDMGDEVRSVNSLSGGESFLVSLALALGLSSLAARDTRVESLLIDEGFGTLDPQTLEVALSVLDALQASGRQVGLISHVPGLAERIGVRVVVRPQGGGRSVVRVAG